MPWFECLPYQDFDNMVIREIEKVGTGQERKQRITIIMTYIKNLVLIME